MTRRFPPPIIVDFESLSAENVKKLDKGWMLIMAPLLMMGVLACSVYSMLTGGLYSTLQHTHQVWRLLHLAYEHSFDAIQELLPQPYRHHHHRSPGTMKNMHGIATKWWWVALNVDCQWGSAVSKQASAQLERAIIGIFDRIKVENYSHLLYDNGIAGIVEHNSSPGKAGSRGRNVTPPSSLTTYPDEEVGMSYPWVPRI